MVARAKGSKSPPNSARGKSPPNSGRGGGGGASSRSMNTAKGVFSFTMVTDGCYIEHKWGQNSGHVGVPLEAIPQFVKNLEQLYQKTTGEPIAKKSPGGGVAAKGIVKGGKKSPPTKAVEKKEKPKKEKKELPAKKTPEELDAELMEYTAARAGGDEPAAAPAEA